MALNLIKLFKKIYIWVLLGLFFVVYRLPLLGFDIVNTDAPIWKTRTFQFASALASFKFKDTAVTYHPGVTLMWLSTVGLKLYKLLGGLLFSSDLATVKGYVGLHFFQKFSLILFLGFVLVFSLYIIYKLWGKTFALSFFFLFTFEPYVLGLTRVLHTDAIVGFLLFSSLLSLYYYMQFSKLTSYQALKWLFVSSFFAGLAVLTKSNSLFIFPFSGLLLFLILFSKDLRFIKKMFSIYFVWLLGVLLFAFLFWPALWVAPLETLKLYYSGITGIGFEEHLQSWFGIEVANPGPLFYPIVLLIRLTPWALLFSLSGVGLFLLEVFKYKKINRFYLISFLFIILYLIMLTIPDKKLGRYAFPVLPFVFLFASLFLTHFIRACVKPAYYYKTVITSFLLIFALNFFSTFSFFPDYLFYYSPIVKGYTGGSRIEEPKWPLGYSKLARYLNSLPNAKNRLVLVRYGYLFAPFYVGKSGTLSQQTEKDPGVYFVLEKYSDFRYLRGKSVVLRKVMKIDGVEYFWIYEIVGDTTAGKNEKFHFYKGYSIDERYK
ncbi:MAG TPA: hypothetical protein ENJ78_00095 [candidate division WWE3 bacterium]|uniref:Glycosyltransferase RgtA/B/C/D-like domain-containing protein n=1 Tax=candidate division WWE3 bacterium TaxID=2053526 RepID=A0A7V5J0C9_UNCKA|nr:hypothetical protein [candidate division WWE3 bacterium]